MSRRESAATEAAVRRYRSEPNPGSKAARRALAAMFAAYYGIHKTTLYRALGWYKGKVNGSTKPARRAQRRRA